MKILYLVFTRQNSFKEFIKNPKTNCPWVDTLVEEFVSSKRQNIAVAIPISEGLFQKSENTDATYYGLPNPETKNIFKKIVSRITRAENNSEFSMYVHQAIRDFNPDIIQIFGSENPFGMIAIQQNKPVVLHIQGIMSVVLQKWFSGISKWKQFRYAGIIDLLFLRGIYNEYFVFKKRAEKEARFLKSCNYFIGRTAFDKRLISLVSPGSSYFHCEEFIRKEFFEKQWNFPLNTELICVSILKGTSYKGIDLLIETLLILKQCTSISVKFKVCGVAENEEIVNIIKRIHRHKFASLNIEFLGKLSAEELVTQLCSSNIYIHPSYIENSPNSVCEAMSLGLPVISTNVGGISSLIDDGIEGILVQEGDPNSLAAAVIELFNNFEYAKLLGKKARERSMNIHKPGDLLIQLETIYNTIIEVDGSK